jgi:hypothetical protein
MPLPRTTCSSLPQRSFPCWCAGTLLLRRDGSHALITAPLGATADTSCSGSWRGHFLSSRLRGGSATLSMLPDNVVR